MAQKENQRIALTKKLLQEGLLADVLELGHTELVANGKGDEAKSRLGQHAHTLHLLQGIKAQAGETDGTEAERSHQKTCHQISSNGRELKGLCQAGKHQACE